jgi:hypothetical protein
MPHVLLLFFLVKKWFHEINRILSKINILSRKIKSIHLLYYQLINYEKQN